MSSSLEKTAPQYFMLVAVQVCSFFKLPLNTVAKFSLLCSAWYMSHPGAKLQLLFCSKKLLLKLCVINDVVRRRNGIWDTADIFGLLAIVSILFSFLGKGECITSELLQLFSYCDL